MDNAPVIGIIFSLYLRSEVAMVEFVAKIWELTWSL